MVGNAPELYASLPPESQKVVDTVASAFITSLTNILKYNFKQNKFIGDGVGQEYTSSQKLAIAYANRWFTGVINELVYQLSNINPNTRFNRNFKSNINPLDMFVEPQTNNDKGNYTCPVPHTKTDGNGQIKVNYANEMNNQTSELTAQDFGHLLFTGLQHQNSIKNTLQQFWSVCGSLLLKSVTKIMKSPLDPTLSSEFCSTDASSKFDDLVFSKSWYQAVDESFGIVPINTSDSIEGIAGFNELIEMSKKLENDMKDAIEQAKVLSKIKSLIADQNNSP